VNTSTDRSGKTNSYCKIFLNQVTILFMKTEVQQYYSNSFLIWNHGATGTLRYRDVLSPTQPEMRSCPRRPLHLYSHHAQQAGVRPRGTHILMRQAMACCGGCPAPCSSNNSTVLHQRAWRAARLHVVESGLRYRGRGCRPCTGVITGKPRRVQIRPSHAVKSSHDEYLSVKTGDESITCLTRTLN